VLISYQNKNLASALYLFKTPLFSYNSETLIGNRGTYWLFEKSIFGALVLVMAMAWYAYLCMHDLNNGTLAHFPRIIIFPFGHWSRSGIAIV
jgi:hypothetical protein